VRERKTEGNTESYPKGNPYGDVVQSGAYSGPEGKAHADAHTH
jgi:hypothetical protein